MFSKYRAAVHLQPYLYRGASSPKINLQKACRFTAVSVSSPKTSRRMYCGIAEIITPFPPLAVRRGTIKTCTIIIVLLKRYLPLH